MIRKKGLTLLEDTSILKAQELGFEENIESEKLDSCLSVLISAKEKSRLASENTISFPSEGLIFGYGRILGQVSKYGAELTDKNFIREKVKKVVWYLT